MNGVLARMILECYIANARIDLNDKYGSHFVMRGEALRAAKHLRALGATSFSNIRQVLTWARSDNGLEAMIAESSGMAVQS